MKGRSMYVVCNCKTEHATVGLLGLFKITCDRTKNLVIKALKEIVNSGYFLKSNIIRWVSVSAISSLSFFSRTNLMSRV